MRLGVILPNWVGDVVMATPALRALRKLAGTDGQLIGIMRPYVAEVLAGATWLDRQIVYQKSARFGLPGRSVIGDLQSAELDQIVLLTNSWRTAWMAWRSGARRRIGFRGQGRSLLLTDRIRLANDTDGVPLPTMYGYLQLAEAAGCPPETPQLELATTADDERLADAVWKQLQLPPGERIVILNSGGAFGAAKLWPAEYFAELARRIVATDHYSVVINCGPAERDLAREIATRANDSRVASLADVPELPVGLAKALIRRARLLVTTDSGPRFFGVAFDRPVITIFGPTDPQLTRLPYKRETCLSLSLDCQPCMARVCPLGHHRCMRDLGVDMVHSAVNQALQQSAAEHAA